MTPPQAIAMQPDVQLYLGDCLEILPELEDGSVDAVVTDPPYNIGFQYETYSDDLEDENYIKMIYELSQFSSIVISQYPEEMMRLIVPALGPPDHVSAWCYNAPIPRRFRLINYYGTAPRYNRIKQPYKNKTDKRIIRRMAGGSNGAGLYEWWDDIQVVKNVSKERTDHPCPLPTKLVKRLIILATDEGDTILDPFMGSGTTGVACMQTGRNFIGVEIEPKYYEIAEQRIEKARQQLRLGI